MKPLFQIAALACTAASLSGCGTFRALELYDRAIEFNRVEDNNDALGAATAAEVAARSGTAVYTGQSGFGGEIDESNNVLISAPMTLTADFDAQTVSGEISRMMISELTDQEIADLRAGRMRISTILTSGHAVIGEIDVQGTIESGEISATTEGTVTKDNLITYAVSGEVEGTFRGSDLSGVALDESDTFTVTRNGEVIDRSLFQAELQAN